MSAPHDERAILHCDCNSFFASVEAALNPAYRDVPMAVSGNVQDRHGIILAKNEQAKRYGIVTAETVFSARKKCPSLVLAEPHYAAYSDFSRRVNAIYAEYTDMVEPFGIDESWLDVTASGKLFGTGRQIAEQIRRRVREEIGITVSIGVSFNKVFAKFGSDYKKPDAITEITRENYRRIVWPSPVGSLLMVGKKTERALSGMGIATIGELAQIAPEVLEARFGVMGKTLVAYARGEDRSPVCPEREEAKSVSNGLTFRRDLTAFEDCKIGIDYLCDEIGMRLRKYGLLASSVSLTVKDPRLVSVRHQRPLAAPTDLSRQIAKAAFALLSQMWTEGRPIRMLTVSVQDFRKKENAVEQLSLFESVSETARIKQEKNEKTVDKIRQKYGVGALRKASVLHTDIGIPDADFHDDPKKDRES